MVCLLAALGTNLALNANASQSTTRFGGTADLAVDGNVDGFFSSGSVTHTGDDLVYVRDAEGAGVSAWAYT